MRIFLLLVGVALLSIFGGPRAAAAPGPGGATLSGITIEADRVLLRLDGLAAYTVETTPLQKNLVLELPRVAVVGLLRAEAADGLVKSVRARTYRRDGVTMARVVIRLNGSPAFKVARSGNDIEIAFQSTAGK